MRSDTLSRRETAHETEAEALEALERETREPSAKGGRVIPPTAPGGRWTTQTFHADGADWLPGPPEAPVPAALALALDIRGDTAEC